MSEIALSERGMKLAKAGQWLAWLTVLFCIGFTVSLCTDRQRFADYALKQLPKIMTTIDDRAWFFGCLVLIVGAILVVWFLVEFSRLFGSLRAGSLFSETVEKSLNRLSIAALSTGIYGILQRTLLGGLLSLSNPPGKRVLVLEIGSDDTLSLIVAIFLFLFAQIIREARRADDENRAFV